MPLALSAGLGVAVRRLFAKRLVLSTFGLAVVALAAAVPFPGSGNDRQASAQGPEQCSVPVDVSLVFDHTGSMDDTPSKFPNAKSAAIGFINGLAGGPSDNDLTPHQMALIGYTNGVASVDVTLGTNAATMRTTVNGYTPVGRTNIGLAIALGQAQLEPAPDPDAEPDTNDYIVLLSDGSANQPADVLTAGAADDVYLDVNDNGYIDNGDDLSVDFPGGDAVADFVVVNGLWQVSSATHADQRARRERERRAEQHGRLQLRRRHQLPGDQRDARAWTRTGTASSRRHPTPS